MPDDLDRMLSGGAKSAKFEKEGDTITGLIVEIAVRQATEYGTGKPQTFDNGDPKEQIVVIIKAEGLTPEDDDDDLHRAVYIKGWGDQRRAFQQAVRQAAKPQPGDRFTATLTGFKASTQGGFPAKVYEYRIQPLGLKFGGEGVSLAMGWVPHEEEVFKESRAQAQKLLDMGTFTNAQVAAATGLPIDEVEAMTNVPF